MIASSVASVAVNAIIKESLMKDFCINLSAWIILQNVRKCHLNLARLDRDGYIRLIDSIANDYRAIKPLGIDNLNQKKEEFLAAIDIMEGFRCIASSALPKSNISQTCRLINGNKTSFHEREVMI